MTRRAFTLVEMVVAIGIIVLLATLTITATVAIVQKSEIRQTEDVVRLLDMAIQEWEAQADRKLSWGDEDSDGITYEMDNGTPHVFTVTELMRVIRRSAAAKPILAQIPPDFTYTYKDDGGNTVYPAWLPANPDSRDPDPFVQDGGDVRSLLDDFDGEVAVLDAWDNPLRVVHPGRVASRALDDDPNNADMSNIDGTVFINRKNHGEEAVKFYGVEEIYGIALNRRLLIVSAGPDGLFGDLSEDAGTDEHDAVHDNIYSYAVEDDHEAP